MEFSEIVRGRRSIRRFLQKPIPDDLLKSLVDDARFAPSGRNAQALRYTIVRSKEICDELFKITAWAASVKPKRDPVPDVSAPVAFIVVSCVGEATNLIFTDAGAAIQTILLSAYSKGIGSCWLGAFDRKKAAAILKTGERSVIYVVALGYPDENPVYEDVGAETECKYYLDDKDRIHVQKYNVDTLTNWR